MIEQLFSPCLSLCFIMPHARGRADGSFISLLPFKKLLFRRRRRKRRRYGEEEKKEKCCTRVRGRETGRGGGEQVQKVGVASWLTGCQINWPSFIQSFCRPATPTWLCPPSWHFKNFSVSFFHSKVKGYIYKDKAKRQRGMVGIK